MHKVIIRAGIERSLDIDEAYRVNSFLYSSCLKLIDGRFELIEACRSFQVCWSEHGDKECCSLYGSFDGLSPIRPPIDAFVIDKDIEGITGCKFIFVAYGVEQSADCPSRIGVILVRI